MQKVQLTCNSLSEILEITIRNRQSRQIDKFGKCLTEEIINKLKEEVGVFLANKNFNLTEYEAVDFISNIIRREEKDTLWPK